MTDHQDDPDATRADGRAEPEPAQPTLTKGPQPADPVPVDGATARLTHEFGSGDHDPDGVTDRGPAPAARPPRFLGEYEILEELARGGMGIVYRARQVKLDRIVALKLIRDASLATYAELRRFQIEAEAVAQLDHPNIVPIYEVGQTDDQPYFSMRLIEGGNLTQHKDRFKDDPRGAATLMAKVARAVHYAHQRAILHRDLKPSNILIGDHDEPYVTDFGLAKRIDAGVVTAETITGAVMGTPAYMPPEQARGGTKNLTTAADIYSLGATFYETLTGQAPFSGDSPAAILRRVLDEEPARPRTLSPELDPDLETICLKCLEKDPSRRYGTAEGLAEDLERWLDGRPIKARPVSRRERALKWMRRNPALSALIGVSATTLISLVTVGFFVNRSLGHALDQARRGQYSADMNLARRAWDDREVYRVREYLEKYRDAASGLDSYRSFEWYYLWKLCEPDRVTLSGHRGDVLAVAYSPDGQRLASGGADRTVRIWDPEQKRIERVLEGHTGSIIALDFSRDGKLLASGSADGTARLWDVASGECLRTLLVDRGRKVVCLAFSPDRHTLALSTEIEDRLEFWDIESGQRKDVFISNEGMPEQRSFTFGTSIKFSLDGSRVYTPDKARSGVTVWHIPTRRLTTLKASGYVCNLCLTSDDRWLIALTGSHSISVWNTASETMVDFPPLWGSTSTISAQVACSRGPHGEWLAFTSSALRKLDIWDFNTRRRIDLVPMEINPACRQPLAFRPDGGRLAIAHGDQIVVTPVVTVEPARTLVFRPGAAIDALAVRDDGSRLAWSANSDPVVFVWDPGRGTLIRSLTGHKIGVRALAYGPAARSGLLASAGADGKVCLWDSDRDGPARATLSGHAGEVLDVAFLPDGRTVVSAGSDGTVRAWDTDTGRMTQYPDGKGGPMLALAVAPNGDRIVAVSGNGSIQFWDVRSGRLSLFPLRFDGIAEDVAFSPEGDRIAVGGTTSGSGGIVAVWEVGSGSLVGQWTPAVAVRSLVFSDDGRRVITGGDDGRLVVWDAVNGRETIAFKEHDKRVQVLATAPKLRIYSAGLDGKVRLWQGSDPGPASTPPRPRDRDDIIRLPARP